MAVGGGRGSDVGGAADGEDEGFGGDLRVINAMNETT